MLLFKIFFTTLAFIIGSVFASFGGAWAYRLLKGISIIEPASFCPKCGRKIKNIDKIPVLSWIFLGGKCRYCKSKIGILLFATELLGGLGFMFAYLEYGNGVNTLPLYISVMLLIFLFIIIAVIDYETHEIFNLTLLIYAILASVIVACRVIAFNESIWSYLAGAVFGFGFFGLIKLISHQILKKDALGSGDVYLVGIGGLMLGILPLLIAVIIATLVGSVIEIIKIKTLKSKAESEIAFAPYLLLGIGIMAICGDKFMKFYWEVALNAFV